MKKLFLFVVAAYAISAAAAAFGQTRTQSISFDDGIGLGDAGTYNSDDSFSVDLYLTYNGYEALGFSLWFATSASAAPHLMITGRTFGTTFPDPVQPSVTYPIGFTHLESSGLYGTPNPSDLGSTIPIGGSGYVPVPPGTYFIGTLSVSLAGLPPGIYTLQTDATSPHSSEVSDTDFMDNNLPASLYTITVIPEPGTLALLSLGVIGLVAALRMGRHDLTR